MKQVELIYFADGSVTYCKHFGKCLAVSYVIQRSNLCPRSSIPRYASNKNVCIYPPDMGTGMFIRPNYQAPPMPSHNKMNKPTELYLQDVKYCPTRTTSDLQLL